MFVVTLPSSAAKNPKAFVLKAKKAGANIVEIRSDLTPNVQPFVSSLPVLVSLRGKSEDLISRIQPSYIDCEIGSQIFKAPKAKLILSFHDYKGTPSLEQLKTIVTKGMKEKPWAIKIATTINSYADLQVLHLIQNTIAKKRMRSIVLGMGDKAHLTRVLSPFKNIFTYASLDGFDSSASGQLPLSFYELLKGRKKPAVFGILGGPHIVHSMSPVIHNALFQAHKIDAVYSCFPSEDFSSSVRALWPLGLEGFSVTAPFKHDAFDFADTKESIAEILGVANTLVRSGKKWKGWNTDWYGISEGYPVLGSAKTVAVLGAGGAVPSVILAAHKRNPRASITVFARDIKKAKKSLKDFHVSVASLASASKVTVDVVICGVSQDVHLPMPKAKTAIDLRYGKVTAFMKDAKKKKMRVHDGISMLIHQALKQFTHFTGKKPSPRDATLLKSILSAHSHVSHGK